MSALEALRTQLAQYWRFSDEKAARAFPGDAKMVQEILDLFEWQHPGLRDYTVACAQCGAPMDGFTALNYGYKPVCDSCQRHNTGDPR